MIENSSVPAVTDASQPPSGLYLGLISGTSADGIDAALVRFQAGAEPTRCELLLGRTYAWNEALRERLVALGQGGDARSLEELGTLDIQVAEAFADAVRALIDEAGVSTGDVQAIGSHGQTVRHRPAGARYDGQHPFTWQIGDG
ncbi:anhydro-N-acetylmuramic acid kinase, partial [Lysobacter sp. 2RAB21]